ncbi:COX assembly mitochondrial protein [Trichonephila clavata]|uniref:COX assembly mitochondrial protein n=1 Tax=Trichonephila clavata TaxID=2740835 RepID=A0A8X6FYH7_TRICU|nr:COX assembly mitochondrial protein [Trichonephila clavata]
MLPPTFSGGPKGLGDPDDRTLRKVEKDILVPMKIRDKTKKDKCFAENQAFAECCKASGFWMIFKCRGQTKTLNSCLEKWYHDEELKNICLEEYLQERAEYRRTGISQKQRRKESAMF